MEEGILFGKKKKTPEELKEEAKNPLMLGKSNVSERYGSSDGYLLRFDQPQAGVESNYYWLLRFMRQPGNFGLGLSGSDGQVIKLKDLFTAGAASSYWGNVEQRKSIQQEKATSLMMTIGKLLKDSFQILRELRILDERLSFYEKGNKGDKDAENSLKDVWITVVEKGTQNPSSVYGMATKVGFVTLPQLFMNLFPKTSADVEKEVKKLSGINKLVLETLSRKLMQYMIWREHTHIELKTRRKFMIGYLRQHYNAIRVNMDWLRPYLRNIKQLSMRETLTDADIASAFETSKIELELLGQKKKALVSVTEEGYEEEYEFKKYFPCVLVKINFIAMPQMIYSHDQQRSAMHMGRTEVLIQGYVATQEQIDQYKKSIEEEDIDLIESYAKALGALEEDLVKYLKEGGEIFAAIEEEIEKPQTLFEPITGILDGFKEMFGIKVEKKEKGKEKTAEKEKPKLTKRQEEKEKSIAKKETPNLSWNLYNIFKKGHGMITP